MFYIDPVYFWYVLIPVLIISLGVQVYLKRTYAKWSKIRNSSGNFKYPRKSSCAEAESLHSHFQQGARFFIYLTEFSYLSAIHHGIGMDL